MFNFETFEGALRNSGEAMQYAAFFALFVGLGIFELLYPRANANHGKRWVANITLTILCVLTLGVLPLSALVAADFAAENRIGLLNYSGIPAVLAFVVGFLLRSLLSFLIHVAFHKAPWLWRIHAVHHTDTDIDVTTAVRMHPLEFVVSALILLPCVVAFGIPALAIILYEIFDAGMAAVTHANIRMPRKVDGVLRWILVTPDMHRIHHSSMQQETDSNFGATFSFWDRLLGTYRVEASGADGPRALGLSQVDRDNATSLSLLLGLPVTGVPQDMSMNTRTQQEVR